MSRTISFRINVSVVESTIAYKISGFRSQVSALKKLRFQVSALKKSQVSTMLTNPKLISLQEATARREALRSEAKRLTITNGCFDLLHAGHVYYLREAARQGDVLWLLLNSDASVSSIKGPTRPVQSEQYRAYVMAALECIDAIILFPNPRLDLEIRELRPDIYVKAGDYTIETINPQEKAALFEVGADIRFLPFLEGFSSSDLMRKIREAE